mgnify:CR=1 FL=1
MNKTELIAAVAEKTGLSKKDTEAAVNATLLTICLLYTSPSPRD